MNHYLIFYSNYLPKTSLIRYENREAKKVIITPFVYDDFFIFIKVRGEGVNHDLLFLVDN